MDTSAEWHGNKQGWHHIFKQGQANGIQDSQPDQRTIQNQLRSLSQRGLKACRGEHDPAQKCEFKQTDRLTSGVANYRPKHLEVEVALEGEMDEMDFGEKAQYVMSVWAAANAPDPSSDKEKYNCSAPAAYSTTSPNELLNGHCKSLYLQ